MGGRNLCSTASIYQLQSRDRTALVIGAQDDAAENTVPHDSRTDVAHTITTLLELECGPLVLKPGGNAGLIHAWQQQLTGIKAKIDNTVEIAWTDWPDGRLS